MPEKTELQPEVVELHPCNEDGFRHVRKQKESYEALYWITVSSSFFVAFILATPIGLSMLAISRHAATVITKLVRILNNGKQIYERFKGRSIKIYPSVVTGIQAVHDRIDLYIRFPEEKAQFFVEFRSMGSNSVYYSETKGDLRIRKKKGGTAEIRPCPLSSLSRNQRWLIDAENRKLFGLSSKQASKSSTARILAICGNTEISPNQKEELYATIGQNRYLAVQKRGTTFVVKEDKLADFIEDWLSQLRN